MTPGFGPGTLVTLKCVDFPEMDAYLGFLESIRDLVPNLKVTQKSIS